VNLIYHCLNAMIRQSDFLLDTSTAHTYIRSLTPTRYQGLLSVRKGRQSIPLHLVVMSDNRYFIMYMPQSTADLHFSLQGTPVPNNHTMKVRLHSFLTLAFLDMVRREKSQWYYWQLNTFSQSTVHHFPDWANILKLNVLLYSLQELASSA
jgi:hypothetical protein